MGSREWRCRYELTLTLHAEHVGACASERLRMLLLLMMRGWVLCTVGAGTRRVDRQRCCEGR